MTKVVTTKLSKTVDDAVRSLVRTEHFRAGTFVNMPVMYPSGATVVLEVFRQKERYYISDRGGAAQECDLMGALRYFSREAVKISEENGISFDGHSMFIAEASPSALSGALVLVSHSSQQAATQVALKHAERTEVEMKDVLYSRLRELYVTSDVVKDAEFRGASSHKWKIGVLVSHKTQVSAFEAISNHYNSVTSAYAKFGDIARLESPPRRFAVVRSVRAIGDFAGVIHPAVNRIIEIGAPDDTYTRLMAA